jgi:ribonuclease HI
MTTSANQRPEVTIYTDGGADPNPGAGGWGAILLTPDGHVKEISGGAPASTNNRMELTAAMEALSALDQPCRVTLFTDSKYLKQGITVWMHAWRRAGWKRKGGELKNVDLWQALSRLVEAHTIRWNWVKGHAGNRWNERADELASAQVRAHGGGTAQAEEVISAEVEVLLAVSCPRQRGAWAALVCDRGEASDLHEVVLRTSGPRLEILAAAAVLEQLEGEGREVAIRVASDYLRKGASMWLRGWRQSGWQTKAGSPVKNRDAWERLDAAQKRHNVRWAAVRERPPERKALEKRAKQLATDQKL